MQSECISAPKKRRELSNLTLQRHRSSVESSLPLGGWPWPSMPHWSCHKKLRHKRFDRPGAREDFFFSKQILSFLWEEVGDIPMVDCRSDWFEPIWWRFYMWWFHERFFFFAFWASLEPSLATIELLRWCIGKTPNKHSLRGREGFAILNDTGYAYSI